MDVAARFRSTSYPRHWFPQLHFRKQVTVEPDTLLRSIVLSERLWVNSIHSQAIDRVGVGLRVSAREGNGVAQAVEARDRFCLGVQFHPELLVYRRAFRRIFRALVDSARHRAAETSAETARPVP